MKPVANDKAKKVSSKRQEKNRSANQTRKARANAARTLRKLQERAKHDAATSTHTDAAEWFRFESESLVSWAAETGWLIDPAQFKLLTANLRRFEGGLEHIVMFSPTDEGGLVIKLTKPPNFGARGTLVDYVNNVIWSNILFEDDIRLAGVLKTDDEVSVVTTQPFIRGRSPTQEQIREWFVSQGYVDDGFNKWRNGDGAVVADSHPGNFILMSSGLLVPIDLQVLKIGTTQIPAIYRDRQTRPKAASVPVN